MSSAKLIKLKRALNTRSSLARLLLLACACVCSQFLTARALAQATVTTDKEDYAPYSVVWINGNGFQPGETVSNIVVQIAGPAPGTEYESWSVVADTNGNLETDWLIFSDEFYGTTLELTSAGLSSGLSAKTQFSDAFGLGNLFLNGTTENGIFTTGDTIVALNSSVDASDAGHKRYYKIFILDAANNIRSVSACAGNGAGASGLSFSYTVQASDPVSNSGDYKFVLRQYTGATEAAGLAACEADTDGLGSDREKESVKTFNVAKATVYANSSLTTVQSCFGAGATAYVTVAGLEQNQGDIGARWILPSGGTAAENNGGGDRPGTSSTGLLPDPADSASDYLQYPARPTPDTGADQWNWKSKYEVNTFPVFSSANQGQWRLRLERDNKHFVTLTVFNVDTTAPIITAPNVTAVTSADDLGNCSTTVSYAPTATDNCSGSATVVCSPPSGSSFPKGTTTVTAIATDAAGNKATNTFTVSVSDNEKPIISLSGASTVTVECHSGYTDAGATASDNCDGNLTSQILTSNPVNASSPGTYTVTYNVSDAAGNAAVQVTRTVIVSDTTKPLITLNGSATVTVECHTSYSELGASVSDSCDTGLTAATVGGDPVNVNVPGTYVVIYNATDASGHPATQVTRTVTVQDTIAPVITLNGNASVTVECHTSYTDAGATASDSCGGDLTSQILSGSDVNVNAPGTYHVTYNVSDASGNPAVQVTRTVTVNDTIAPVITLTGSASVTVECHTGYTDAGATASDSCGGDLTSQILSGSDVNVNAPGTYHVTYNVSDASGNPAVQVTRTATVTDTIAPVITLTGSASVTVECHTSYTDAGATASDSCGGDLTSQILSGSDVNVNVPGTYHVTYNVSDASGNPATQVTRTVTVTDTIAPVITLTGSASVTVECHTSYTDAGATASDSCGGDLTSQILSGSDVSVNVPGTYHVTYNVSDASGNPATQVTRTVTVTDTIAPVITLTGSASVTVECHTSYTDAGATASDSCGGDLTSQILSGSDVNVNAPGTYHVTYNVSDASGNPAVQVTRTVTVTDTIAPVITLTGSASVTVECHTSYTDAGATASDSCGGDLTSQILSGSDVNVNAPGTYHVTYNVSDASGNPAVQVTRTVTVTDTIAPVITLTGSASVTVECHTSYTDAGATASDGCGGDLTSQILSGSDVNVNVPGTYHVTYNVSDASGNPATQVTRTVTVTDTIAPVITLTGSASVTVECHTSYTDAGATASDSCGGDLTSQILSGSDVNVNAPGTYHVTYNVSDASGNPATQVTRTVTVNDTIAPVITLTGSASVTVECHTGYTDAGATASDSCGGDLTSQILSGSDVNVNAPGTYHVTYNVSDASGNPAVQVTRTVTVTDTIAPVITLTGSASVTVECHTSYTDAGATASDSCGGDLTSQILSGSDVNVNVPGTYHVTYNVSDASGNPAVQVTRTVTVNDTIAPVITLTGSASVTVECHTSYTDAGATASDSCGGDLTSQILSGSDVNVNAPGTYHVTYNVSDASGNPATQVTRTVTVNDTIAPVITLTGSASVTVECHTSYTDAGATASDSCGGDLTSQILSGSDVNVNAPGTYHVTYNVSDASGNPAVQVTRTLTVNDTIAPVITLTGSASVTVECHTSYTDAGATASDSCGGDLTSQILSGSDVNVNAPGTYHVTYNVSDASGNPATQVTRTVTVNDTIAPVITLTGSASVTVECHTSYTDAGATASDSCGGDLTSQILSGSDVNVNVPGTYHVTYNVSDASGNPAVQVTRTVTVNDTIAPVITLTGSASVTVECHTSYTDAGATASDGCGGDLTSQILSGSDVNVNVPGTYHVTYNVSDASGNPAVQVTRTVNVTDTIAPTAPTIANAIGECSVTVTAPTALDNCAGAITGTTVDPLTYSSQGTFTVHWSFNDGNGNTSTANQMVIVDDVTAPEITCPGNVTGDSSTGVATFVATATDNCGTATVNCYTNYVHVNNKGQEVHSGDSFPAGTTTVTVEAADAAGNIATRHFTVTRAASCQFTGFLQPIGGADATGGSFSNPLGTFKLGSTIPVKFRLICGGIPNTNGVHTLQAIKFSSSTTSDTAIDATPTDAATTGNQFRLTDATGQWHFNLSTRSGFSAGTWKLVATLSDGSQHIVWIALRK